MWKVAFATLGCRLNQADSSELQGALETRGFTTVPLDGPDADVVVINTCTVTSRADFSDRQAIHRAVRQHPDARIVVTGCWAQMEPAAVARVPGVDLVVGNADKARLPELVDDLLAERRASRPRLAVSAIADVLRHGGPDMAPQPPTLGSAPAKPWRSSTPVSPTDPTSTPGLPLGRSRAFVKIQDGCQYRCAFCIVPFARGGSRSQEPKVVVDRIRQLVEAGFSEVTLTGVDMGHYGWDLYPRTTLAALVRQVVDVPGLRRVRLSSVLPAYFGPELIEVVSGSPVVAPHLHIPLQSGSDRVLRRMRRPYSAGMYRRLVERLAGRIPDLGLGADVIVGFPGETADDFAATIALIEDLPLTYLHVFPYSDRRGTEAAGLGDHVDPREIGTRSRRLRALGRAKNLVFRRRLIGSAQEVVVLETRDRETGDLVGLTGNYVEVVFPGPDTLMRRVATVRMAAAERDRTRGTAE